MRLGDIIHFPLIILAALAGVAISIIEQDAARKLAKSAYQSLSTKV